MAIRSPWDVLCEPVLAAGLRAYRVAFGFLMAASLARFWAYGWIPPLYFEPTFQFHYWPFGPLTPTPGPWLYGVFALGIAASLTLAFGVAYRLSMGVWLLAFVMIESLDKTLYLNHYVLMSCLGAMLWFMPLGRGGPDWVPRWQVWSPRVLVGSVYVHAALAKITPDWLLRGEPLNMWLVAKMEVPWLGWLGAWEGAGLMMSWAGFAFDLCIVPLLLWPRSRVPAYLTLVSFHAVTWALFPIGVFPWVMIASSTLFLPPDWPHRVRAMWQRTHPMPSSPPTVSFILPWWGRIAIAGMGVLIVAVPLRSWIYPGTVHWHEQGYRFAWKVMLQEKTGDLTYRARHPETGQVRFILPSEQLSVLQSKMLSTQPDMILEYAHHLSERLWRQTGIRWEIYADAWVSWNGRPAARLIDPTRDLAREQDTLMPYTWVLPAPEE